MMQDNTLDLMEALEYIDPASLCYQDWLAVGMGLKESGYPASVWDDWSRGDPQRYHTGECQRKWNGFSGADSSRCLCVCSAIRMWRYGLPR